MIDAVYKNQLVTFTIDRDASKKGKKLENEDIKVITPIEDVEGFKSYIGSYFNDLQDLLMSYDGRFDRLADLGIVKHNPSSKFDNGKKWYSKFNKKR